MNFEDVTIICNKIKSIRESGKTTPKQSCFASTLIGQIYLNNFKNISMEANDCDDDSGDLFITIKSLSHPSVELLIEIDCIDRNITTHATLLGITFFKNIERERLMFLIKGLFD